MVYDLLDLEIDFNKAIEDNYRLKDGLYIKIGNKIDFFIYKDNKKIEDKSQLFMGLDGEIYSDEYEWFIKRDYLSNFISVNKALDPPKKKIHNNNYLTLFVKAVEFKEENREHFIDKLYNNLKTFNYFTKKQEKEIIKTFVLSEERKEDIENKKELLLKHFDLIQQIIEEKGITNYVKIFFDENIEKYMEEAQKYFLLKIYNKIETTLKVEDKLYGLSDFNMGLNQKKPYLAHKTRGIEYPFMVESGKIFEVKKLFDYLKYQNLIQTPTPKRVGIFLNKHSNNDQAEITDFDLIVKEQKSNIFEFKNYIGFKTKEGYIEKRDFKTTNELLNFIDEVFYNYKLQNNLYNDVYSKLDKNLQNLIYLTRGIIINFLRGESLNELLKFGIKLIESQKSIYKMAMALNLYLSLKGEEMNILENLENLEQKVLNLDSLNDEEFFILSGQIGKYLLDKSKKSEKNMDMLEPFLRVTKSNKLKKEIEHLFFKYKHEIPLNYKKFNNALSLVMGFEKEIKVDKEKLLIGLLSENIFYNKKEQK